MAADSDLMQRWLAMAKESTTAARVAHDARLYRSSVSRAYFALYHAATALFLHLGLNCPSRGNWAHASFPRLFGEDVVRRVLKNRAIEFKGATSQAYFQRCEADYAPAARIDAARAKETMRLAGMVFNKACEVTGNDPDRGR